MAHKTACPACRANGKDKAGDNLIMWPDGGAYCFSCGYTEYSNSNTKRNYVEHEAKAMEFLTEEEHKKLKGITSLDGMGFRGIRTDISKWFGVRYEFDTTKFGVVSRQYTPNTTNYELSGYKTRVVEGKKFFSIGYTGQNAELFGQFRFKNTNSKICIITGGEVDQLSAFQMLKDYYDKKAKDGQTYDPTPVVSPTIGESGCVKQIKKQYQWFSRFDKIIVCFDNDEVGKKSAEEIAQVLPKGKVFIASMTMKDANEYLVAKKENEFLTAIFQAKKYLPSYIVSSDSLMDKLMAHIDTDKIPLPPFMSELSKMIGGGIPLGYIVNLFSASGTGKTTVSNEIIYHWFFNSPHRVGVLSLELDAGQYAETLVSRHLERKISLIESKEEKRKFLIDNKAKCDELWTREDGQPRFVLLDERDGSIESIKAKVEEMVLSCDCKVIVIDPLQDILDGLSNEEQAVFMRWEKNLLKSGVTIVNINHVRKSGNQGEANSAGAFLTEEDIHGSSSIMKSGGINIACMRNKYAEDDTDKNTTKVMLTKNRYTGITGWAGEWYYDNATHRLHDKLTFFAMKQQPQQHNVVEIPKKQDARFLTKDGVFGWEKDGIFHPQEFDSATVYSDSPPRKQDYGGGGYLAESDDMVLNL